MSAGSPARVLRLREFAVSEKVPSDIPVTATLESYLVQRPVSLVAQEANLDLRYSHSESPWSTSTSSPSQAAPKTPALELGVDDSICGMRRHPQRHSPIELALPCYRMQVLSTLTSVIYHDIAVVMTNPQTHPSTAGQHALLHQETVPAH